MGPEALRTRLALLRPADLASMGGDESPDRFCVKMLTEGSGTQDFQHYVATVGRAGSAAPSAAANASGCVLRTATAKADEPTAGGRDESAELDPVGSLVDADMSAYYNWLNQQRLPGANQSSFLVWF